MGLGFDRTAVDRLHVVLVELEDLVRVRVRVRVRVGVRVRVRVRARVRARTYAKLAFT